MRRIYLSIIASVMLAMPFTAQAGLFDSTNPNAGPLITAPDPTGQNPVYSDQSGGSPYQTDLLQNVKGSLPSDYAATQFENPINVVNRLIRIALSFLGIILLALMVRAGFLWMTAAGNEDQVATAKTSIRNATIGLVVILSAYSFVWYIGRQVQVSTRSYGHGTGIITKIGAGFVGAYNGITSLFK